MNKNNIDSIIESIKNLNIKLEPIVKKMKSEIIKEKGWISFSINEIDSLNFEKYKNKSGVYFFQVRLKSGSEEQLESNNIFEIIEKAWNEDERGAIPPIVKERFNEARNKSLINGDWSFFYLGKSNELEKRVMEHLGVKGPISTSKLNLCKIKNRLLKNCEFRIKIKELNDFKKGEYYWVISKIERDLRKELNPICGK